MLISVNGFKNNRSGSIKSLNGLSNSVGKNSNGGSNNEMNRYIKGFFVHNTLIDLDKIGGREANCNEATRIVERDIRYLKSGLIDHGYCTKARANSLGRHIVSIFNDLYFKRFGRQTSNVKMVCVGNSLPIRFSNIDI